MDDSLLFDSPASGAEDASAARGSSAWAQEEGHNDALVLALAGTPDNVVEESIRQAFGACDINGDGAVSSEELHAVLCALGCDIGLDTVAEIVGHSERRYAAVVAAATAAATTSGNTFLREFSLGRLKKKQKPPICIADKGSLPGKAKAFLTKPVVCARHGIERAVYRVISDVTNRKKTGILSSSANTAGWIPVVAFEGIRCQFGKATESRFVDVHLTLQGDVLTITTGASSSTAARQSVVTPGRQLQLESSTQINLRGCTISLPKVQRRGYPHTWRLDTQTAEPVSGASKFTFAASEAALKSEWMERMKEARGGEDDDPGVEDVGSVVDAKLDLHEFAFLIKNQLAESLPGNWRQRCRKIVKLRRAFLNADLDGDQSITRRELHIVLLSNNAKFGEVSPQEMDQLWHFLDPEQKGEVVRRVQPSQLSLYSSF